MNPPEFYEQVAGLINKDLDTYSENMAIMPQTGLNQSLIREKLAGVIQHLLDTNFEKLCQAMYRLDVSEAKFDKVLTEIPKDEVSSVIADLVIEREIQKVKTRMLYKNNKL